MLLLQLLQQQQQQQGQQGQEQGSPSFLDQLLGVAKDEATGKATDVAKQQIKDWLGIGGSAAAGTAATNALTSGAASAASGLTAGSAASGITSGALPQLASRTPSMIAPSISSASTVAPEGASFFTGNGLLSNGAMGVGDYIPGVAGAIGAYDVLSNKKHGWGGAAEGALSGAGIGMTVGGPVGAAIGAPVGGLVGYFGNFGDKNRFQDEYKAAQKLRDNGVNWGFNQGMPSKGRSINDLVAFEQDKVNKGQYGNVAFAKSRNEKDLKPEDIWGYSAFGEKYGNDWLGKFSEQQRRDIAQKTLDSGAVDEHHGTISVDWNKVGDTSSVNKYDPNKMQINRGPANISKPTDMSNMQTLPLWFDKDKLGEVKNGLEKLTGPLTSNSDMLKQMLASAQNKQGADLMGQIMGGQGAVSRGPLMLNQPQKPDAGTLRRWRLGHNG
jgi:hypothetical protein